MNKKIGYDKILCTFLLICTILGNAISFGGIRIAGLVLNLYRVGIPIIAMICLCKRLRSREMQQYLHNKIYVVGIGIMIFWAVYGTVILFMSPYSNQHEGIKEILNIILGALVIYSFTECCKDKGTIVFCMHVIRRIIVLLVLGGIIELVLGIHLHTSKYAWDFSMIPISIGALNGLSQECLFPVTSICFGVNDFAVLLAIFFPTLFVEKEDRYKVLRYLSMILVIFLISVNDANICLLALLIVSIVWLIVKKFDKHACVAGAVIISVQFWLTKWFEAILVSIKTIGNKVVSMLCIKWSISEEALKILEMNSLGSNMSTQEAIMDQLDNMSAETGSLFERIMLAADAFQMWLDSKLLGMGPASYTEYVKEADRKSKYINPHNWWLEILSQYGIFVFIFYVGFLIWIFFKCVKEYLTKKDVLLLRYISMLALYVICSIAPSSFINYSYQWLIVGMGMVLVNDFK